MKMLKIMFENVIVIKHIRTDGENLLTFKGLEFVGRKLNGRTIV